MKILFLSHIYPAPWDYTRGTYNLNTLRVVSEHADVRIVAPWAWWTRVRRPERLPRRNVRERLRVVPTARDARARRDALGGTHLVSDTRTAAERVPHVRQRLQVLERLQAWQSDDPLLRHQRPRDEHRRG